MCTLCLVAGNVVCLDSDTESENVSSTHYLHRNSHEVEVAIEVEEEAEVSNVRKKRKIAGRIPMSEEDKAQERREKLQSKEAEMLRKIEEKAEKKRQKEEEKKKLQEDNRRKREVCLPHLIIVSNSLHLLTLGILDYWSPTCGSRVEVATHLLKEKLNVYFTYIG